MVLTKEEFYRLQDQVFEDVDVTDSSARYNTTSENNGVISARDAQTVPQKRASIYVSSDDRPRIQVTRASSYTMKGGSSDTSVGKISRDDGYFPDHECGSGAHLPTETVGSTQLIARPLSDAKSPGLFVGLVFYFIPCSRVNAARAARMQKVERLGGVIVNEFNNETTTHVIVDRNITRGIVLKSLGVSATPSGICIFNEYWTPDCVMFNQILASSPKYSVEGMYVDLDKGDLYTSLQLSQEDHSISQRNSPKAHIPTTGVDMEPIFVTSRVDSGSAESPTTVFARGHANASTVISKHEVQDELDITISTLQALGPVFLDDEERNDNGLAKSSSATNYTDKQSFKCAKANFANGYETQGPNDFVISKLLIMQKYYETSPHDEDKWKPRGYRLAIASLQTVGRAIRTYEEAIKLPHVGERLAMHISEIARTGTLAKTENLGDDYKTLQLFLGVYGVGPSKANQFVRQKLTTLDDLLRSGLLSTNQKIGVHLYDHLNTRIPRTEVHEHKRIVKAVAMGIDPELQIYTMGSYRRGAPDCGDIDIMITRKSTQKRDLIVLWQKMLAVLEKQMGFLTHALLVSDQVNGLKWQGICKLGATDALHRRIDFLLVPWEQRGPALLYFTGNDLFNRSIRLLARKKGYTLNEKALMKGAIRLRGIKLTEGENTGAETEEEIFAVLGIPFRRPEERCVS